MATVNLKAFPYSEDVECPECAEIITMYDPDGSEHLVCPSCNAFIHFNVKNIAVTNKKTPAPEQEPVLKLGSTGMLHGHDFKVIGYAEKKEKDANYKWREYILYNYDKGYANLAEYDGHWTFVAGKEFYPKLSELSSREWDFINFEGNEYKLFNKYTAVTKAIAGEFDWDILSEQAKTSEFISPPNIIYKERGNSGAKVAEFYLGIYTEPEEIVEAFKADLNLFPTKTGIGANQPSKYNRRLISVIKITPLFMILVAALGFILSYVHPEQELLNKDFYIFRDSLKANEFKPFISPSFEVKAQSALQFKIGSDIDNNWLEATIVLVNENDNQSWEVTESIEYYRGYEGGESWSEGSKEAIVLLSKIPAGKYHLNIYPAAGDNTDKILSINVNANPVLWRNFWITILILTIYPLYNGFRRYRYEKKRWMSSDYSPYDA